MLKLNRLRKTFQHQPPQPPAPTATRKLAIVGQPNVGKSVLFHALTGVYVTVSNYPGTTVEVSRGNMTLADGQLEVVDTPGAYSLAPVTEEERVARTLLMEEAPDLVLQVVDAKNLARMLPFTLQLLEAGLPLLLVVNIMDEATRLGMTIDCAALERELGIPVVPATSTTGVGIAELQARLAQCLAQVPSCDNQAVNFPGGAPKAHLLWQTGARISLLLRADYGLSHWLIAQLLLCRDPEILALVEAREGEQFPQIRQEIEQLQGQLAHPANYLFLLERQATADRLVEGVTTTVELPRRRAAELLSDLMIRPLTGLPILGLVLYLGLFLFVGKFGAGFLVDLLQNKLFGQYLNPLLTGFVERHLPWPAVQDLFVHDYGLLTMSLAYAVAIILPIVGTFFLVFSVIEDTGYLPRLALLIDRFFKAIGLSGRAVIPLVLGFGCGTMATLVTRVLESRRERLLATLLLALAVPCSAQLGIILGLLSGTPLALIIWAGVVGLIFLLVGFLSSRVIKGESASFFIEIPPLRQPQLSSILTKTAARMKWYLWEVLPLFLAASLIIWLGRLIKIADHSLFDWLIRGLQPLVLALGLPEAAAPVFLFGFFRRDYGAAGLYELHTKGLLAGVPLLVAMVTMTLFIPCLAQWLIMKKERGLKTTLAISAFIIPFAWLVGFALYRLLLVLGVKL